MLVTYEALESKFCGHKFSGILGDEDMVYGDLQLVIDGKATGIWFDMYEIDADDEWLERQITEYLEDNKI